ncbi:MULTISPECIES: nitrous oxide reductase accessory protein NosL [Haloferax]|uniref:Nitrous oxide reductase accessory protein NosL n=1 Tax=Haloferax marinum TaxID=2666143 RepID=A0A6A8GCY5_9EURY|nr:MULTISPECIES: nitrous oxide reductase accessory protein NosL [Haloferax]KAB1191147.1 nitrous oxide reductase accessory protein NosL [Haloferax sp. CBA1150]MRW98033.1 nitrous oxide reductase accessory protein NosL [Haloferax marinum]
MDDEASDVTPTRRAYLTLVGFTTTTALAGCLGGDTDGDVPTPIALTGNKQCDVCGMMIEQHPGPVGQLFYAGNSPEGHDNPAWFCSAWETFAYNFDRTNEGWNLVVGYLTDYSAVDYELVFDGGATFISAHLESEAFGRMDELYYVVGTEVKGSMGNDLVPFSDRNDAETFAEEHDGRVYELGDISRELVAQR